MPRKPQMILLAVLAAGLCTAAGATPAAPVPWESLKAGRDAEAPSLNGRDVTIRGYMLPVDREGSDVYQFVLMPVAGGCSHTQRLPPDQMLLVTLRKPIEADGNYRPVSVSGTLRRESELSQFYILDGVTQVKTGYAMRGATVAPVAIEAMPKPAAPRSPWKFLNNAGG